MALTPQVASRLNEEVAAGERLPYALMCFDTQDRLTYQAWIDDLLRYVRQANAVIGHYEESIRTAREVQ